MAPSLIGGTPFRSPGPHTLPWEGSANHFSEACPAISGKKHVTAHYRQAKLNSRNLINIATETGLRQHGYPANRDKGTRNHPSKPGFMHFAATPRQCGTARRQCRIGRGVEEIPARIYTELSSILCAIKCLSRCREKTTLSTFYWNRPYCFICVMDSGLWRFKIREQHGSCGQGKCFLAFHGGRRGRRTECIGRKFRQC